MTMPTSLRPPSRPPPTVAPARPRITREGSLPRWFSSLGARTQAQLCVGDPNGVPPADATRGGRDAGEMMPAASDFASARGYLGTCFRSAKAALGGES